MKFLGIISTLLSLPSLTIGFLATHHQRRTPAFSSSSLAANVLEGKEIEKDFTPINNMLLVRKGEIVDQTDGGIFLTGKEKINKSEGEVVSAGDGRINSETGFQSPMPIAVGDTVSFGKYDGEEIEYNGAKHTLLRDDDILVKFPSGAERTLENAQVIWDNVLIKIEEVEDFESGGLLVAATVKKSTTSSIGEVVKVGPGKLAFNGALMEMDVAAGDMVKFRDFAAQEVEINGEDYAVVRMNDLLAKF